MLNNNHRIGRSSRVRPNILLMDDDVTLQEVTCLMLRALGYNPTSAWDGDQAIELYKEAKENGIPFDAVILDIQVVDGRGGSSTIRHLREFDPNIKAIVSSACVNDPLMQTPETYGFKKCLPKPYAMRDLLFAVEEVLKSASAGM